MANTPVEFSAPSGLTLRAKLFALGSDTVANSTDTAGDSSTENTNNLTTYSFTVTQALAGWYRFLGATTGGAAVSSGLVYVEDTTTRRYVSDSWLGALAVVDGKTFQEATRYMTAVLAGKVSGAGTGTETFKGLDGTTNRVVGTVDSSGNRTAVSYDTT